MDRTAKVVLAGTALTAIAVIALLAYPSAIVGFDADDLSASVNDGAGTNEENAFFDRMVCRQGEHADWRCGPYRVNTDWRGCWSATPNHGNRFARPELSGCVSVTDLLGLNNGPLLD